MAELPVVLITGAGRGLGRVMTMALIRAGMRVVLTSTQEDTLRSAVTEAGGSEGTCATIAVNLADESERERLIEFARRRFGGVDILINNAARTPEHLWPDFVVRGEPPPWEIGLADYRRFLEVDAVAPHHLVSRLVPDMIGRGWGRIVNVSTSLDTMLALWPYGSAKAALEAYSAVLSKRLVGTGVTCNVLLPGGFTKAEPVRDAQGKVIRAVLPPSNMVGPVLWLCSRRSDGVCGRRIVASQWDTTLPDATALAGASYPVAWTGLGVRAAQP